MTRGEPHDAVAFMPAIGTGMDLSYDANLAEIFETIAIVVLPPYVAVQKRLLLAVSCRLNEQLPG